MRRRLVCLTLLVPLAAGTASARAAVPLPGRAGAWHQVGAAAQAKPGRPLHFFRSVVDPGDLALVVAVPGTRAARVVWGSYCEFQSDDEETLEDDGSLAGSGALVAYPRSFPAATLCYVSVAVMPPAGVAVSAAVFTTPKAR